MGLKMKRHLTTIRKYPLTNPKAWKFKDLALKLDWNESDENLPEELVNEACERLKRNNLNWYPQIINEALLAAISNYVSLPIKHIRYAPGSDAVNEYLLTALLNYGDNVCIVSPNYDHFRNIAEVHGAVVKHFSSIGEINYKKLGEFIENSDPIAVYISSPNNPTGVCLDNFQLIQLLEKYRSTYFVIDEAYYEYCGRTASGCVLTFDNLAVTRSLSKAFGAASIRFGYLLASQKIIDLYDLVANVKATPLFTQIMAEVLLNNRSYVSTRVARTIENRKKIFDLLDQFGIEYIKSEGNFVLVKLDSFARKKNLIERLEKSFVFIRDYSHLKETENCVRVTIGSSEKFGQFISDLKGFLENI